MHGWTRRTAIGRSAGGSKDQDKYVYWTKISATIQSRSHWKAAGLEAADDV